MLLTCEAVVQPAGTVMPMSRGHLHKGIVTIPRHRRPRIAFLLHPSLGNPVGTTRAVFLVGGKAHAFALTEAA